MSSPRYLCSHLVRLTTGTQEQWANLEEIWETGAVLDCEEPVDSGVAAMFSGGNTTFRGRVLHANEWRFGWRVELELSPATPWSVELWQPEHALDPGKLST